MNKQPYCYFEDYVTAITVILKTISTIQKEYGMALTVLLIGKRKIESQFAQLDLMMINYLKTH